MSTYLFQGSSPPSDANSARENVSLLKLENMLIEMTEEHEKQVEILSEEIEMIKELMAEIQRETNPENARDLQRDWASTKTQLLRLKIKHKRDCLKITKAISELRPGRSLITSPSTPISSADVQPISLLVSTPIPPSAPSAPAASSPPQAASLATSKPNNSSGKTLFSQAYSKLKVKKLREQKTKPAPVEPNPPLAVPASPISDPLPLHSLPFISIPPPSFIPVAHADLASREHPSVPAPEYPPEVEDVPTPNYILLPQPEENERKIPAEEIKFERPIIRHAVSHVTTSQFDGLPPEGSHTSVRIDSGHDPPEPLLNYYPDEQLSGEFDY